MENKKEIFALDPKHSLKNLLEAYKIYKDSKTDDAKIKNDAINYIKDNPSITNILVQGNYGTGKTTFLKANLYISYLQKNKKDLFDKLEFIYILFEKWKEEIKNIEEEIEAIDDFILDIKKSEYKKYQYLESAYYPSILFNLIPKDIRSIIEQKDWKNTLEQEEIDWDTIGEIFKEIKNYKKQIQNIIKTKKFNKKIESDQLFISLLEFNKNDIFVSENNEKTTIDEENNKENQEENNKLYKLEDAIIQKLVINSKDRYTQKRFVSFRHNELKLIVAAISFAILFATSLWFFFKPISIEGVLSKTATQLIQISLMVSSVIVLSWYTYLIVRYKKYKNFKFKKIFKVEFEENSPFDNRISELLDIFKKSGYKHFVFEDIDRQSEYRIVQKLVDLNKKINDFYANKKINDFFANIKKLLFFVNKKKYNPENDKIHFYFTLKYDLFNKENTTKFFDYILRIPFNPMEDTDKIISRINNIMKREEKDEIFNLYEKWTENLLDKTKLVLRDMGYTTLGFNFKLKNIIELIENKRVLNDFVNYLSELLSKKEHKEYDEAQKLNFLFLAILYTMYPDVYSNLYLKKGFIYNILVNIENTKTNIKRSLYKIYKKIDESNGEKIIEDFVDNHPLNYIYAYFSQILNKSLEKTKQKNSRQSTSQPNTQVGLKNQQDTTIDENKLDILYFKTVKSSIFKIILLGILDEDYLKNVQIFLKKTNIHNFHFNYDLNNIKSDDPNINYCNFSHNCQKIFINLLGKEFQSIVVEITEQIKETYGEIIEQMNELTDIS
ncbi:YobI family P-loop NTPase [Mycoplasma zalophi]|uniref:YobI family P-loop NTPase n=1 Tax=Mycoplasma zalophi TaxID=191287 RepID=UPI001C0F4D74|nr:hypothetical protein [Mycoplasma zalophi]MBU4690906.1 hypothetical protein [Mycoplasma zalophi]